ncbi:GerAB/ArcD/ProY family transporter [Cohnella zeiphila]|uniref:GerAB/ArcD/ProY family transporter n=1 Tax=Cohnella zeiphila TaxID=2761120 RepID=A0A7X0SSC4_9BACL|nr:GerAB/ArcD/ProY family transporter [Cohnella zeiphila]MBB6735199.1 GerAB/ArcD/ProY family transporter [Cohnella zeiphila]
MMEKKAAVPISAFQMSLLLFAFMTGSAIINIPGPIISEAFGGAWISLLFSGAAGLLLLGCLLFLHRAEPDLSYVECSKKALGTAVTFALSVMTVPFLLHIVTGIVIDVGLFMNSSMLRETPNTVFNLAIFAIAALTARAGIEVMARMFALILMLIIPLTVIVLALAIPNYQFANLLPVFPYGWRPIWHGAYSSFGFPFEEIFVFGMLLKYTRKEDRTFLGRSLAKGFSSCILFLILSTLCTLMLFGPLAPIKKYSLFELARIIEAFEIIQRIESVIGMSLIAGSYMKESIALFVLAHFVSDLFKLKDARAIMMPLALIGFLNSLVSYDSNTEWIEIVNVMHPLWAFGGFTLPLLLTAALIGIKRRRSGARASGSADSSG